MANILLIPHNWHNCNMAGGGEHYLSRIVEQLKSYGHQFRGIAACSMPFTHNEITFYPQGEMQTIWSNHNDLLEWADLVFTQLMGNPYAYNKCRQHKKPMMFFAHNSANHYFVDNNTRIVYNSQTLADLKLFPNEYYIQQPLIPKGVKVNGSKIALINCNKPKGAELFNSLAKELPYSFMGIKGAYGEQILSEHVSYVDHSNKVDWGDIKLLLVPSEIESWSQVASEAIAHGIPVIATPLPGIKENLSYAGIYIDKDNVPLWKETITQLMDSYLTYNKQVELCLKRAGEYNNCLDEFNEWLIKI